jgi:NTE family protein
MSKNIQKKESQRALVLQGGGALGAYEAGAFNALYEYLVKENQKNVESLFDVVAGTSSGAINSSILVSYVQEHGTWKGSAEHLINFWKYLSSEPNLSNWWPFSFDDNMWVAIWQNLHEFNNQAASGESARRYYSAKEYLYSGAPGVFSKPKVVYDNKFFDEFCPPQNLWFKYDNTPLKESIKSFIKKPIKTNYDDKIKQPRLLMVSVDVLSGKSIVFDSYPKPDDNKRYSTFKSENQTKEEEFVIQYDEGILPEHIIASTSVPLNYDYATIEAKIQSTDNSNVQYANNINNGKATRFFWDGGLLNNTPLRALINEHQDYWLRKGSNIDIPDLDLYIVDVHTSYSDKIALDRDGVINRSIDIMYHNRNLYDIKVANIVSDYVDLTERLERLAKQKGATKEEIDNILKIETKSKSRRNITRTYKSLLDDRFNINEVHHFEREYDKHAISGKAFDFSFKTINQLITKGFEETKAHLK